MARLAHTLAVGALLYGLGKLGQELETERRRRQYVAERLERALEAMRWAIRLDGMPTSHDALFGNILGEEE